jgi:hypothetical protein
MRSMHRNDSPADVSSTIYNNSQMFDEPLADAYLLRLTHVMLLELAQSLGTSPDYFVRRAFDLRRQFHFETLGVMRKSEK